jgi:hypothetical protein
VMASSKATSPFERAGMPIAWTWDGGKVLDLLEI